MPRLRPPSSHRADLRYRWPVPELDWLPDRTRESIEVANAALTSTLADNLVAVCLIGQAAKRNRSMRGANAELLVVANSLEAELLQTLAGGLAGPLRAGLQIRTVTATELAGSVDVHALEIAQWRDHHLLLQGRDPFSGLEIRSTDLRHEIERSLRSLSHRLRNRMLWCLATEQFRLDSVLREGIELLTMLGHHSLSLAGETPPEDDEPLLARFLAWAGADPAPLQELRKRLDLIPAAPEDPIGELAALATATEAACAKVDALEVEAV